MKFLCFSDYKCRKNYSIYADMLTAPPIPLSLYPPPLCMQRRRYSLCGIHAAALLKHAVVGWGLHHADYEGVGGVSHWYYCFAASVFVLPCKLSYLYPSVGGRRTHSSNMRSYPLLPFREIPCRMVLQSPPYREDIRCS